MEEKTEREEAKIFYCVQCGAFFEKKNAERLAEQLKQAGFEAFVTEHL